MAAFSLATPGAPGPSPFTKLEGDLRRLIAAEERALSSREGGTRARETLQVLYYYLHDLRNHQTFWELWNSWPHGRDTLQVLYPGSGSHLAPLVFLYGDRAPREVSYVYTELDGAAAGRMEALLQVMKRGDLLDGLTTWLAPVGPPGLAARWKQAISAPGGEALRTRPEAFLAWFLEATRGMKPQPGFGAEFRFSVGPTRARILLLIGVSDKRPGSTPYYCQADLQAADLVVTHDWDSSPRGNLKVLFDLLESARLARRQKPLAVMMEDLRNVPYPIDLSFFRPAAASPGPYGHVTYVRLPDGTRLDTEDGAALCDGGVVLDPDLKTFGALSAYQVENLFDLLLLAGPLYDRGNVDVLDGCHVTAPALLDMGLGYGYREIHGMDLRGLGKERFPVELAAGAVDLLASPLANAPGMRGPLCALVSRYTRALREKSDRDVDAFLTQAARDRISNPFLKNPKARAKFEEAYAAWPDVVAQLERDAVAFQLALGVLDHTRDRVTAACGAERAGPPSAP